MKPQVMWAVVTRDGVFPKTLRYTRIEAIKAFREEYMEMISWRKLYGSGYRARRVEVKVMEASDAEN